MSGTEPVGKECTGTAAAFNVRAGESFENLDVLEFARVKTLDSVAEIGAGTGKFLVLFAGRARLPVAIDLTPAMLEHARGRRGIACVAADSARVPLKSRSIDLVVCAMMLHHVERPVAVISEMARVCAPGGRILIVDQMAPERYEQAIAVHDLEVLRDPTHTASRPPQAFEIICSAAGLTILDRKVVDARMRLSEWMSPNQYAAARVSAVKSFVELRGCETGMDFERDGEDWWFTARRIMILAEGSRR